MKDRPILFSGPMVRALLAGTKTQTRRILKVPHENPLGKWEVLPWGGPNGGRTRDGKTVPYQNVIGHTRTGEIIACPYGQPGDRLRVKEAAWMWCERRPNGHTKTGRQKWLYVPMRSAGIWYAADHRTKPNISVVSPDTGNEWGWRLKIGRFLPAWASRITLEITAVRVERLQDISPADCEAEGVQRLPLQENAQNPWYTADVSAGPVLHSRSTIGAYHKLWEQINGPGSWDANPWVWVVEFRRTEK
jgi:hypothetical protein